ncbi:SRPBCC family protein [Actinoalloteichus caeruleus]|uniref:Conserved protein YndB, AHSA1/START domain n=1 Tax=Actinoalloteichus caeruleus DSM 43889 TaxID=1120930 RepID=A0ABT1JJS3_ACTCY|nr:SRPBCC family protein [Actinoalloteichus caeruleus]MCP2332766.1 putative conserved protein YndB, AHSA1/START domain [Actinoalloteichus caeruleus DSM 43889]
MEHQRRTTDPRDLAPPPEAGTLGLGDDGAWQILFRRHLAHPIDRVWSALSQPEHQREWLPGVRIEVRPGGSVLFDFGDEGSAEGTVAVVEAPTLLEHSWCWSDEPPSTVRWELATAADGGTELVLRHRAVDQGPAADFAVGWHGILDGLRAHLDGGTASTDHAALDAWYRAAAARS